MMNNLITKINKFSKENELFSKDDSVLISASAGKDSITLIDYFLKVKDEFNLNIGVFHLNHLFRGEDSDLDENFILKFCKKNNIPFHIERYNFSTLKGNFEENARNIRYEFLNEIAQKHNYSKIATAHTLSDSNESILLNLFRGTSIAGLSGIKPKMKNIIRPLLCVEKEQIYEYLKKNSLLWREDKSNADNQFNRNYIRNKIIPLISQKFDLTASLNILTKNMNETENLLNTLMNDALLVDSQNNEVKVLIDDKFKNKDFFKYSLIYILNKFYNHRINSKILEETYKNFLLSNNKSNNTLYKKTNFSISKFYKNKSFYLLFCKNQIIEDIEELYISDINNINFVENNYYKYRIEVVNRDYFVNNFDKSKIFLDADNIKEIRIRSKNEGDRILLNRKNIKIKKILINNKLNKSQKFLLPIIDIKNTIAAIMLHPINGTDNRINDEFLVKKNTKKILAISSCKK